MTELKFLPGDELCLKRANRFAEITLGPGPYRVIARVRYPSVKVDYLAIQASNGHVSYDVFPTLFVLATQPQTNWAKEGF